MTHSPKLDGLTFKQLRAIATPHPQWPEFMRLNGVNSATVNMQQLKQFISSVYNEEDIERIEADKPPQGEGQSYKPQAQAASVQTSNISSSGDHANQLAKLIAAMAGQALDAEAIKAIVNAEIKQALAQVPSVKIEMEANGVQVGTLEGIQHPKFKTLATMGAARLANGYRPNIWLSGPAGSGKTHAAGQLAKLMGLTFGAHGAMSMAHELVGFVDANGAYHETQFVKAYRNGGLCLLDELDAGENSALLALNAALANSHMSLPNGEMLERHKDFICLGAANTWGQGATADYIGRNKLDAAFLARFVALDWGYDIALEQNICGNIKWAERVQAARARAKAAGLKVVISPRDSINGAALIAAGLSEKETAECTYLKSLSPDQIKIVEGF